MSASLGKVLLLASCLWLTACAPEPELHRQQFFAFGTLIEISLYDVDTQTARSAIDAIETRFQHWHTDWHAWQPSGLTRINAELARTGTATVDDPQLLQLITTGRTLSLASGGRFNPAAGGLFALWGFQRDEAAAGPVPEDADIAAWLNEAPDMRDLDIEGARLTHHNPKLQLDLGAIAKGYASTLAIELLKARGIHHAIVAAAGDLHAIGRHGERPWHIGIRHPRGAGVIASTDLADGESISTSGDYERYFEQDGVRYHHLLDPASGRPARTTTAVTVIHTDGATADAAATALFIAGDDWPTVARVMGVTQVMRVDEQGAVELTPAMAQRLQFAAPVPETVRERALP